MKNERKLIFKYAQGKKSVLPNKSLINILKQSLKKHCSRQAIVYHNTKMSYQELDLKSNAMAAMLQMRFIKKGDVVLVEMENSIELVVSLMGILKLGAIYLPISPDWPLVRKKEIEKITKSKIILVTFETKHQMSISNKELVVDCKTLPDCRTDFCVSISAEDAVYGFFTSGSTGVPKCAINTNVGLLNRLMYMNHRFGCSVNDVILQNSKNIFDASLWQLLWPLMNGALLVIPHNNENFVSEELAKLIEKYQVTVTDFVPSLFSYFINFLQNKHYKFKSLRQILIGGEEMNVKDVAYFKKEFSHIGITNTYGPTECSIGTIFYEVPTLVPEVIPIGRPIDNVSAILLKKNMQPVGVGENGEIYLTGACVGLGYLKNKRKTNQVFLRNHFTELLGGTLYKTGDFGVYLANGDIQYKGRMDQQVKINGVRIELGEIENNIKKIPNISMVFAYFDGRENQKKELSILVTVKNKKINERIIKMWCQKNLPFHLVPNHIKIIENMPFTATGKVDRKRIKDLLFE